MIGLIGQVPAKVKVEEGKPVRAGDALTSAAEPGYARLAGPGEPTVGVALEDLKSGEGIVNVLISRRNSSITVDSVEAKVLETVAAMEIEDEVQLMITDAVENLDAEHLVDLIGEYKGSELATAKEVEELESLVTGHWSLVEEKIGNYISEWINEERVHFAGSVEVDQALLVSSLTSSGVVILQDELIVHGSATFENSLEVTGELIVNGESLEDMVERISGSGSITEFDLDESSSVKLGDLVVHNALTVLGDITIEGLAKFLGDVEVEGELIVSKNQAGVAQIPETGERIEVSFDPEFESIPVVTATSNSFADWRLSFRSQTGFIIELRDPAEEDVQFSWTALATKDLEIETGERGDGIEIREFPVDQLGYPLSESEIWNGCIRQQVPLDEDGKPYNCSRYHDGNKWVHPDLGVEFEWDSEAGKKLKLPEGWVRVAYTINEESEESEEAEEAEESLTTNQEHPSPGAGENSMSEEEEEKEEEEQSESGSIAASEPEPESVPETEPEPQTGTGSTSGDKQPDVTTGTGSTTESTDSIEETSQDETGEEEGVEEEKEEKEAKETVDEVVTGTGSSNSVESTLSEP